MFGFELYFWDYATFLAIIVCVLTVLIFLVWMAGLPGRIAIARKHPEAEAVMIMGYAGFLVVVPWIQAFGPSKQPTSWTSAGSPAASCRCRSSSL